MTIDNSIIQDNNANGSGGGIYNDDNTTLSINNSIIYQNRSTVSGGGIVNAGNATIDGSRISQNVATNSTSQGGGVYHTGASLNIANSCITLNTSRDGGGILNTTTSAVSLTGNWWGHPNGPTIAVMGNTTGIYGDVVTGSATTNPALQLSDLLLNVPNLDDEPNCFELDLSFYQNHNIDRWGQSGLALEVYLRAGLILGRPLQLDEVFAFTLLKAAPAAIFTDAQWHGFTESLARTYYEYGKEDRIDPNPECPIIFNLTQSEYIGIPAQTGLLCTLGTVSEWYGETVSAEVHAYDVADFIRLDQIDVAPSPLTITWRDRAAMITNPSVRLTYNSSRNCSNWEDGIPPRSGGRGQCIWNWGNYSKLSTNTNAQQRLTNTANQINTVSAFNDPRYTSYDINAPNTEANILWSFAIIFRDGDTSAIAPDNLLPSDFFLLTWNQYTVLRCSNTLAVVLVSGTYFPQCN